MGGTFVRFDPIGLALEGATRDKLIRAGNATLDKAVQYAKSNHPGWETQTGKAEGSISKIAMHQDTPDHFVGELGSYDVDYFIWLEIGARGHPGDHTIQRAAEAIFPTLWDNFK